MLLILFFMMRSSSSCFAAYLRRNSAMREKFSIFKRRPFRIVVACSTNCCALGSVQDSILCTRLSILPAIPFIRLLYCCKAPATERRELVVMCTLVIKSSGQLVHVRAEDPHRLLLQLSIGLQSSCQLLHAVGILL